MLQSDVRKVSAYKAEMQEIIYSKDIMEDNEMTKVDIISLSTNKKCEKKERLFISVSEQRLFIEYEATKSVSGRWNCRDEKL